VEEEDDAEDDNEDVSDGDEDKQRDLLLKELDDLVTNQTKLSNQVKKIEEKLKIEKTAAENAKKT
jgi:hypothetical protein